MLRYRSSRIICSRSIRIIAVFLFLWVWQLYTIPFVIAAPTPSQIRMTSTTIHPTSQYGKIFETNDITNLSAFVDKNTLVVFDIDNTIFRTKTVLGSPEWEKQLVNSEINKGSSREMSWKKCQSLWMKAQKYADIVLLDKNMLSVLKEVRKKAYSFIGFTSRQPAAAEITEWQLDKFGINFNRSPFSIFNFKSSSKYPTLFRQGILFSNDLNSPGAVFVNWMQQIQAQINRKNAIKKIVVIDDNEKNLQSMAQAAKALGIEFVGVRYSAIEAYRKKVNPALIEKEKEILTNNFSDSETWLFLENAGSYQGGEEIIDE